MKFDDFSWYLFTFQIIILVVTLFRTDAPYVTVRTKEHHHQKLTKINKSTHKHTPACKKKKVTPKLTNEKTKTNEIKQKHVLNKFLPINYPHDTNLQQPILHNPALPFVQMPLLKLPIPVTTAKKVSNRYASIGRTENEGLPL